MARHVKADQVHAAALVERIGSQRREPTDLGPNEKPSEDGDKE